MKFIKTDKGDWWELDETKLTVFNFNGGFHNIKKEELDSSEIIECDNWAELYRRKGYCPLEVTVNCSYAWISPDGLFYDGDAHDVRAEEILEIMYDRPDEELCGDELEQLGWIKVTSNLMWEVRLTSDYWSDKQLTQKQYDALFDWCQVHEKIFPPNIDVR